MKKAKEVYLHDINVRLHTGHEAIGDGSLYQDSDGREIYVYGFEIEDMADAFGLPFDISKLAKDGSIKISLGTKGISEHRLSDLQVEEIRNRLRIKMKHKNSDSHFNDISYNGNYTIVWSYDDHD